MVLLYRSLADAILMRYSTDSFIMIHALISTDAVLLSGRAAVHYVRLSHLFLQPQAISDSEDSLSGKKKFPFHDIASIR